jgi:formylmethanofuran dehydrogenase subunit E
MTQVSISPELIQQTVNFHGHSCPGLALGIRVAEVVLAEFGRSSDEDIVAVVETDMCGVDAVQFLTGCTFGKGNLIHLDYGKNAFTFCRRSDGKAMRIIVRPGALTDADERLVALRKKMAKEELTSEEQKLLKEAMEARTKRILEAGLEQLFEITPVKTSIPRKARLMESVICEACGEATMESRTRRFLGQTLCIPCFEAMENKFV